MNGLQVANRGEVTRIAAAVDASQRTIDGAVAEGANFLLVTTAVLERRAADRRRPVRRLRSLFDHDVAVYSAHLPLDLHPEFGNNVLLAKALGLVPSGSLAQFHSIAIGCEAARMWRPPDLVARAARFAQQHGGDAHGTECAPGRRTRNVGDVQRRGRIRRDLDEAAALGVDTLIVGKGRTGPPSMLPSEDS